MSARGTRFLRGLIAVAALVAGIGTWWLAGLRCPKPFPGFEMPPSSPGPAEAFYRAADINPASPQAKAHSATIARLTDGSLRVAWYAGSAEGAGDVGIWMSSRPAEGKGWTPPREVFSRDRVASALRRNVVSLGNPVFLSGQGTVVGLLFVSISAGKWSGSSLNLSWSYDWGETWSTPEKLSLNPFINLSALVRNPPAPLVGGGWAVPIYEELFGKFPEILWLVPGRGEKWATVTRIAGGVSVLQPSLVPLSRDRAAAFFRDFTKARRMSVSWTEDAGRTWTPPADTGLPNPDSGLCVVRLSDGALLCAYNDYTKGKRENLSLATSRDEGRSWRRIAKLEDELGSEFSYPSMIVDGGVVRMVYSARQKTIRYAEFSEAWVREREAKP